MDPRVLLKVAGFAFFAALFALAFALVLQNARLYRHLTKESFFAVDLITFLSAPEIAVFLAADEDRYIANLTDADLHARKVPDLDRNTYIQRIKETGVTLDALQRQRVSDAIKIVQAFLARPDNKRRVLHGIRFEKLAVMPWKIAVTDDSLTYEEGLPHTRSDIIFLSLPAISSAGSGSIAALANTLLHEKIHIYQRQFPEEIQAALRAEGYKRYQLRAERQGKYDKQKQDYQDNQDAIAEANDSGEDPPDATDPPERRNLVRSNPDLDPWIYLHPKTQRPMMAVYRSPTPKNINDVILADSAAEHPYESMAYEIAGMLPKTFSADSE